MAHWVPVHDSVGKTASSLVVAVCMVNLNHVPPSSFTTPTPALSPSHSPCPASFASRAPACCPLPGPYHPARYTLLPAPWPLTTLLALAPGPCSLPAPCRPLPGPYHHPARSSLHAALRILCVECPFLAELSNVGYFFFSE